MTFKKGRFASASVALGTLVLLAAGVAGAAEPRAPKNPRTASSATSVMRLVVSDGGDVFVGGGGAVYGIPQSGIVEVIATGAPLSSPIGVLYDGPSPAGEQFFVSDMHIWQSPVTDGAIWHVTEGGAIDKIWRGSPLMSPFGMVRSGDHLYVADFGEPSAFVSDGAIYEFDLDPDGDGQDGPFPLPASALRVVWSGAPLDGPNELIWLEEGERVLLGDDSGDLYTVKVRLGDDPTPQPFGPVGFFVDPAGVARLSTGFAVLDFAIQEVWSLDPNGQNPTLLHSGSFGVDQFLGSESDGDQTLWFVNAGTFTPTPDGEVTQLSPGGVTPSWIGAPLVNPFDVTRSPERP